MNDNDKPKPAEKALGTVSGPAGPGKEIETNPVSPGKGAQKNKKARHSNPNRNGNKKSKAKRNTNGEANNNNNNPRNTKNPTPNNNKNVNTKTLSKALSWILRHGALKLHPPLPLSSDGYVPLSALLTCSARGMNSGKYTLEDIKHVVETSDKQRFRLEMKTVVWYNKDRNKCKYSFVGQCQDRKVEMKEEVQELCIRANQGHSIPNISSDELLERIPPSTLVNDYPIIVHGTTRKAWEDHIRNEGLKRMNRNHIHFATGLPDDIDNGVISGMRKSCQVYIYINGEKCVEDDRIVFYKSDNGVVLTAGVSTATSQGKEKYMEIDKYQGTERESNGNRHEEGTLPCRYFLKVVDAKTKEDLMAAQTDRQMNK